MALTGQLLSDALGQREQPVLRYPAGVPDLRRCQACCSHDQATREIWASDAYFGSSAASRPMAARVRLTT
jgi:hypothetical protein